MSMSNSNLILPNYLLQNPQIDPKSQDKIFKVGENLKCKVLRNSLETGGKITLEKDSNKKNLIFVGFENTIENTNNLYNFLDNLSENGFLFHGSTHIIDTLEPRQAFCVEKKLGNECAIYFCSNWHTAAFCSLCPKPGKRRNSTKRFENPETGKKEYEFAIWQFDGKIANNGYIYVIPNILAKQIKNDQGFLVDEFISKSPVNPILRIKISEKQFPFEITK